MGETKTTNTTDGRGQTAVLVAVMNDRQDETQVTEYLDELEFLAETAGVRTLKRFVQRLANPNSRTFVGEGKLAEIAAYVEENEVDFVIFDDELSPSQIRNLDMFFPARYTTAPA